MRFWASSSRSRSGYVALLWLIVFCFLLREQRDGCSCLQTRSLGHWESQMFCSLLFIMKISNRGAGEWGSSFVFWLQWQIFFNSIWIPMLCGQVVWMSWLQWNSADLFCCSFYKSSYLHLELWIWFQELFIELWCQVAEIPFSYPILEGKIQILRLGEQTSRNLPYAWVREALFRMWPFSFSQPDYFSLGVCSVVGNNLQNPRALNEAPRLDHMAFPTYLDAFLYPIKWKNI